MSFADDRAGEEEGETEVAARVAESEVSRRRLIAKLSEAARENLEEAPLRIKRRRFFRAKGAPKGLRVYSVARAG